MGGMEKKYLHEGIWYIDNFIDPIEVQKILQILENASSWDVMNDKIDKGSNFYNNTIDLNSSAVGDIIRDICLKIGSLFSDGTFRASLLSRYPVTSESGHSFTPEGYQDIVWAMNPHKDRHDYGSSNVSHGAIFYFNDNYEGGEIAYPDLDIVFKPKANSVICHDASIMHGVRAVTSGTRYVLPGFVFEK